MIERLPATPDGLAAAAALLDGGGLAAFPTDTVYGIGCRADDAEAIGRLFAANSHARAVPHAPAPTTAVAPVISGDPAGSQADPV